MNNAVEPVATPMEKAVSAQRSFMPRLNWLFIAGVGLVILLLLFGILGRMLVDSDGTRAGTAPFSAAPSVEYPFGTDTAGRDLLAMMVYGMLPTLRIGLVAGGLGTVAGVLLGLISGYFGGLVDTIIRTVADIMLSIPSLLVLVVIASYVNNTSIEIMSLIIALFSWPWAARTVRSQTLSLRERAFIDMAKLSGRSSLEIVVTEIMPNLLPYIAASFVGGVSGGILASVGLQLLGLGPRTIPTIGLVLQNAFQASAIFRGMWWWWLPPTIMLTLLFIGLYLISLALDDIANPRLKGRVG